MKLKDVVIGSTYVARVSGTRVRGSWEDAVIKLYVWRFGYKLSEKERARAGRDNVGGHAGCWINDYDCGAPDCPM
ncbi:MAG: hypothetical protein ABIL09_13410, partial [Gemmatimonadota bacterium]